MDDNATECRFIEELRRVVGSSPPTTEFFDLSGVNRAKLGATIAWLRSLPDAIGEAELQRRILAQGRPSD